MKPLHLMVKQVGKPIKFIVAIAVTLVIIILSALSSGAVEDLNLDWLFIFDKAGHGAAYMVYVIVWAIALIETRFRKYAVSISLITAICLGVSLEFYQKYLTVGRAFDYLDMLSNIIGALIGTTFFIKLIKSRRL